MSTSIQPTVSVIIPVFNGEQYICEAISSVLDQTYKDFEIIVVDNGSTDGTKDMVDLWVKAGKVRYFLESNKGPARARNTGIRHARGKFLKFLDCDDLLYKNQLEYQVDHLKDKDEFVISTTDYELEFEPNKRRRVNTWLGPEWLGEGYQQARFIEDNGCPIHAVLVRKDLMVRLGGFDEELQGLEDADLWLRALFNGAIFERLDYNGCCYRILGSSFSVDTDRIFYSHCKVFEKLNKHLSSKLSQLRDIVRWQLAKSNIKLIHTCFVRNEEPTSILPMTLELSKRIYMVQAGGLRKFIVQVLGFRNVCRFKYLLRLILVPSYRRELLEADIFWREEQYYENLK